MCGRDDVVIKSLNLLRPQWHAEIRNVVMTNDWAGGKGRWGIFIRSPYAVATDVL